jgi:hypothetical protein
MKHHSQLAMGRTWCLFFMVEAVLRAASSLIPGREPEEWLCRYVTLLGPFKLILPTPALFGKTSRIDERMVAMSDPLGTDSAAGGTEDCSKTPLEAVQ